MDYVETADDTVKYFAKLNVEDKIKFLAFLAWELTIVARDVYV
jgi:hypothetical protein